MTKRCLFSSDDIVYAYSRADALRDGTLCDLSELSREAGIKYPVAITAAAWATAIEPPIDCPEQSVTGRAWDMLQCLRAAALMASHQSRVNVLVRVRENATSCRDVALKALVHPGDQLEPVITVMLPGED